MKFKLRSPLRIALAATIAIAGALSTAFPLQVQGRALYDATGEPFPVRGDTLWSGVTQMTNTEIRTFVADRAARGTTALIVNLIDHAFSDQTPKWLNVDGFAPFTDMAAFSGFVPEYWARAKLLVRECWAAGILVIANPAYIGFAGTEEGWDTEVLALSDPQAREYGREVGRLFDEPNILWCKGGDADPGASLKAKLEEIYAGIIDIRPAAQFTGHGAPGSPARISWAGTPGFVVNTAYPGSTTADIAASCLAELGVNMPCIMLEARYEQEPDPAISAARFRWQMYQAWHAGCCGEISGINPIWHWGAPYPGVALFPYSGTPASNMDSAGSQDMAVCASWVRSVQWWKFVPTASDNSFLVLPNPQGTDGDRVIAALANDNASASVWVPSAQTIRLDTTDLTAIGNVRVRFLNPSGGAVALHGTFAKSSAQDIAVPGERVVMLDAA